MIPELSSCRLKLRPIRASDAVVRYMLFKDPEVARLMGTDPPKDLKFMARNIDGLMLKNNSREHVAFHWAIEHRQSGHVIGFMHVHAPAPSYLAWEDRPLSYALFKEYWGQGYMAEAIIAAADYLFDEGHIYRLETHVAPYNDKSIRLVENLGFEYEGTCRGLGRWSDERHDLRLYSLLKNEWQDKKEHYLGMRDPAKSR